MTICVLFDGNIDKGLELREQFSRYAPDVELLLVHEITVFSGIPYLISFSSSPELIGKLSDLEVIFSTGAGVDQFDIPSLPERVSVVRMMDTGITAGVAEYVVLGVLALHRDLPHYVSAQARREWAPKPSVAAGDRTIGIMGLGAIGQAVVAGLAPFGFPIVGWSRTERRLEGVGCYAGVDGLAPFLERSDILVCLLPLTAETKGVLCEPLFSRLPRGAMLLNAGRGAHLVDVDLLATLAEGQLSAAMLDVTNSEPLAANHPFWTHSQILLTPHIAGRTRPESVIEQITDNLRAHQAGRPMRGLIARDRGY